MDDQDNRDLSTQIYHVKYTLLCASLTATIRAVAEISIQVGSRSTPAIVNYNIVLIIHTIFQRNL